MNLLFVAVKTETIYDSLDYNVLTLNSVSLTNCSFYQNCSSCSTQSSCLWCASSTQCYSVSTFANESNCASFCAGSSCVCDDCTTGVFPCSGSVVGLLILLIFYGIILGYGAKLIADGSEELLEVKFFKFFYSSFFF